MNNIDNMEKTIRLAFLASVYSVESEPGDGTHYSYFAVDLPTNKEIHFIPNNSEFSFPAVIKRYQVDKSFDYSYPPKSKEVSETVKTVSESLNENFCTVLECMNTARKIFYEGLTIGK